MSVFSEEQVVALAPDEGSVKSGRELASARKWVSFGHADRLLWGECQGSGKNPYQTCVDLSVPSFKCSCPSRKFPCKHGLGLLLLFVRDPSSFANSVAKDWAAEWIASREERAEKKAKKEESAESKTPDPAAKAKRQADRAAKVDAGIRDLDRWLQDRIRQGLSNLSSASPQLFEQQAARLTDAQAPGLARMLRQCADIPNSSERWPEQLLNRFSQLHLLIQGYGRINEIPEEQQQDLRNMIGFTVSQDELLKSDGMQDRWQIMGQRVEIDDRLKTQRTWLRGEKTKQWALILQFAHGTAPLDITFVPGHSFDGELVFYPGSLKMRALVKSMSEDRYVVERLNAYDSAEEFLADYANALAKNPWAEVFPCAVTELIPTLSSANKVVLIDCKKNVFPLRGSFNMGWQMLAASGGRPLNIFGEWASSGLLPLGIFNSSGVLSGSVNSTEAGA